MFAPNPSVSDYWLYADVHNDDGSLEAWESPYWRDESAWSKFRHFRSMNFYNRVHLKQNYFVSEDVARYVQRKFVRADGSMPKVTLYRNGMNLISPEPGKILEADEITWVTFSENAAIAEKVLPNGGEQ